MEDEYKEIVRKFNEIYNPLRKDIICGHIFTLVFMRVKTI